MCWQVAIPALISGGLSFLGAKKQSDAIDDASAAAGEATAAQIGYARESRDIALMLSDPYRQSGYAAMAAMMDMMGLPRMGSGGYGYSAPPGVGEEGWTRYSPDNPYASRAEEGDGLNFTARLLAGNWEQQQGNVVLTRGERRHALGSQPARHGLVARGLGR